MYECKSNLFKEKKIAVLYIITSLKRCGPVNVLYGIVKNLDFTKYKPIIVTLKKEGHNSKIDDFKKLNITIKSINSGVSKLSKLKHLFIKYNIKIVHSHGILPDLLNSLIDSNKYKRVSTIHNVSYEDYPLTFGKLNGILLSHFHTYLQKRLCCVSCSKTVHDKVYSHYNVQSMIIHNGVPFEHNLITRENDNQSKKHFLYLGNITEGKNVEFLIESFIQVNNSNLVLDIVGDGDLYDVLYKKYGYKYNVNFYGRVTNPQFFLQRDTFLVSASLSEGMPMSVIEALSFGLPVLLSDIPSHQEILNYGYYGLTFRNNDKNDFVDSINKFLKLEISQNNIIAEARKIFSDQSMSLKYQKLYDDLLQEEGV